MGHKSWGGARLNKWDIDFHAEAAPGKYAVDYHKLDRTWYVFDTETNEVVFKDVSIVRCELHCDELNSQEQV